jgi:hypothetical protein
MKIALAQRDDAMPRTVYYERLLDAIRANSRFVANEAEADLLLPAEDIALETNWPRYGDPMSAFVRGAAQPDGAWYQAYLDTLSRRREPICIVNMHPFMRLPQVFRKRANFLVADVSLPSWERTLNPRTVSMPALPIAPGNIHAPLPKTVVASFRGVDSHPCRQALARLHDGRELICELVDRQAHSGKIDATAAKTDAAFTDLLARSIFAFVPRGDALFSYRLLEALSFGCIPIVLADGWVLPFDRTVPWSDIALHVPEAEIADIPKMLQAFPFDRICAMQERVKDVYTRRFADLDVIVETLFGEIEARA